MAKQKKQNVIATLAATAQRLIDEAGSQTKLAKGKGVTQRTLSRWARDEKANPRLLNLQELATSLGVEVWQLLVPGFNPKFPPQLAGAEHGLVPQEVELLIRIRNASANAKVLINAVLANDTAVASPKKEST